jgi:hypothetical protein
MKWARSKLDSLPLAMRRNVTQLPRSKPRCDTVGELFALYHSLVSKISYNSRITKS